MALTTEEFERWCSDNDICVEPGCPNECARGYVVCKFHLYGTSQRADSGVITSKRWHERRMKKAALAAPAEST